MKSNLYSVYDKASKTFNNPVTLVSDAVAIRTLRETLADASTILAKYPEDYVLVKIGEFDIETGMITPCSDVVLDDFRALLTGGELSGGEPPRKSQGAPKTPENGAKTDVALPPAAVDAASAPVQSSSRAGKAYVM